MTKSKKNGGDFDANLHQQIKQLLEAHLRAGIGYLAPTDEAENNGLEIAPLLALLDSSPAKHEPAASDKDEYSQPPEQPAELMQQLESLQLEIASEREQRAQLEQQLSGFPAADDEIGKLTQDDIASSDFVSNGRLLALKIVGSGMGINLADKEISIGRTVDNEIQIRDASISRHHAILRRKEEQTEIIDCGSTNGVFVNESRISQHFLRDGDLVRIGIQQFVFYSRPQ